VIAVSQALKMWTQAGRNTRWAKWSRMRLLRAGVGLRRHHLAVQRIFSPVVVYCREKMDRLTRRQQRLVAAAGAISAQLFLVLMLVIGSKAAFVRAPDVAEVTISGPWGSPDAKPKPFEVQPELPNLAPPELQIADDVEAGADPTPGLPNVSRPAEAIAAAHLFPSAPAAFRSGGPHSVTLLLSVSDGGAVSAAAVQTSSGIAALDGMALDWVKKRWRYLPALRNGVPVSVTTTAIVTFINT
jgi:TonB family protein